jgi:hypothetical protein
LTTTDGRIRLQRPSERLRRRAFGRRFGRAWPSYPRLVAALPPIRQRLTHGRIIAAHEKPRWQSLPAGNLSSGIRARRSPGAILSRRMADYAQEKSRRVGIIRAGRGAIGLTARGVNADPLPAGASWKTPMAMTRRSTWLPFCHQRVLLRHLRRMSRPQSRSRSKPRASPASRGWDSSASSGVAAEPPCRRLGITIDRTPASFLARVSFARFENRPNVRTDASATRHPESQFVIQRPVWTERH